MTDRTQLPPEIRRGILVGAFVTEASALAMTRADVAAVAKKILQIAEHDVTSMIFPGPAPCGPKSVFALNGGQWFCGACQRSFWGDNALQQAEGHG